MSEIFCFPCFWDKKIISIGILDTKPFMSITTERYGELVKEGMEIWNKTLKINCKKSEYQNLTDVQFTCTDDYENADVQIYWWFSHQDNGLTNIEYDQNHVAFRSMVMIAKNQGPNVPVMPPQGTTLNSAAVPRNEKQIGSVVVHELGHVLGLDHCNFSKDLMFTGTVGQPDPNRRISNINLQILNDLFSPSITDRINRTSKNLIFNDNTWQSVQQ